MKTILAHLELVDKPQKSYSNSFKNEHSEVIKVIQLHDFNPNESSVDALSALGIPLWLAKRIEKYRNSGGIFRKKADVKKIYGFPEELYLQLEPYITIPQSEAIDNNKLKVITQTKPVITSFDLNHADTTTLIKLKGIGSKLSQRIIKYRDMLGGFYAIDQLYEVYGLDSAVIQEVKKYATLKNPSTIKININESSFEQFRHPYLKPYIAKAIINYRNQHGKFESFKDLLAVKLLDEKTFQKILPYLTL
ncbi:ComEA family DNA-binding protein [Flectobacillus major]|uniref:ComEA family DNA-binding protein n=1 Tax=Flectobacillus major TaxID=103 RepID=UPI00131EF303|nr:helix-hairpin-helix domain-containing protein [Flectobacillus major]